MDSGLQVQVQPVKKKRAQLWYHLKKGISVMVLALHNRCMVSTAVWNVDKVTTLVGTVRLNATTGNGQ